MMKNVVAVLKDEVVVPLLEAYPHILTLIHQDAQKAGPTEPGVVAAEKGWNSVGEKAEQWLI